MNSPFEQSEDCSAFGGGAVDVNGLAAAFALTEGLDRTDNLVAVKKWVASWAKRYGGAVEVSFQFEEGLAPSEDDDRDQVLIRRDTAFASVTVPAHASCRAWISFRLPSRRLSDTTRRLFVVAARICASRIAHLRKLPAVKEEDQSTPRIPTGSASRFLGESPAARQIARVLPRLAASDVVVFLTGETGTGKSFLVRVIHESGPRAAEPLRIVNCAAIPEPLIESELFGHERGAFTGAATARVGAFEAAGGGTLFLDEVGELSLAGQAKLLRVLEDRRFERLGSNRSIELRARVIAATNRDLPALVAAERFRNDLFFRLSVVTLQVPPARERGDDLVLLAKHILSGLASRTERPVEGFSSDALAAIRRYSWPGNVRELRNAIEHAIALGEQPEIQVGDFPPALAGAVAPLPTGLLDPSLLRVPATLARVERLAIRAALRETGGNRTKAAALLGINRQTLYNKLADFGESSD